MDEIFPSGLYIGKKYLIDLPEFDGRDEVWVRRQLNMAIHRRYPELAEDSHTVHVRLDVTCPKGRTEIYVS